MIDPSRRVMAAAAFLLLVLGGAVAHGAKSQEQPTKPPPFPEALVKAGGTVFAAQCGFCHGRDATGGQIGPDLTGSDLVAQDVRGDKIAPVVRQGRIDKGMPPFKLTDQDLDAVVAFLHAQKANVDAQPGRRRKVDVTDLQTGSAEAGRQYFNGPGGCAQCHSPAGDLAGVANRFLGLALLQRMLNPPSVRVAAAPGAPAKAPVATVTVTLPSGETVTGGLVYKDEFTIALTDTSGWHRSWPTSQVKFAVHNPLDAHIELLPKYTDDDIHNLLAYLQTLR